MFQGDLEEARPDSKNPKCVFLTVHDIGTNHSEWEAMTEHKKFEEIKYRAIFIHVDLPGQEDNAKDFSRYVLLQSKLCYANALNHIKIYVVWSLS